VLHFAASSSPNQDVAFMVAIGWTALNLLLSNFFITFDQLTLKPFSQLRYLSAMGYAFEGLTRAELSGRTYNCSSGMDPSRLTLIERLIPAAKGALDMPVVQQALRNPGENCELHADAVLGLYGMERGFGMLAGVLVGYLAALHLATFLSLVMLSRRERR
jgi:hypothetical protein